MDNVKMTFDIRKIEEQIYKAGASEIVPKSGTMASFLQSLVNIGADNIKRIKAEAEPKIKANSERLAKKYADEANAPIIAERDRRANTVIDFVRTRFNGGVDARIRQINHARKVPITGDDLELIQTIHMLITIGADISESDWKMWSEQFTGKYLAGKAFAGLAKMKGIDIIPAFDPEKSIERLETYRKMGNQTIDVLDHPEDSIIALSFLSNNPDAPIQKLIADIDSDSASLIPAEKLTVLQRLKDAERNAFDKDDVALSAKIKVFIERNADKLATPEEINEALYSEAEDYIQKGMSAKKGNE